MADEKTRVLGRTAAAAAAEPRIIDGQIVFFCPAGHRLVVPPNLAGKRGKCSKCSLPIQIPDLKDEEPGAIEPAPTGEVAAPAAAVAPPPPSSAVPTAPPGQVPAPGDPAADGDWNFISGIAGASATPALPSGSSSWGATMPADANPMARLLARLWEERDHGGVVELHLAGGAVILPEEFSPRWSGASHGVFASQAADGSVTLTAVAWDTVQRIVVRQLAAVPGDMFE